jgi:hypothetical protein
MRGSERPSWGAIALASSMAPASRLSASTGGDAGAGAVAGSARSADSALRAAALSWRRDGSARLRDSAGAASPPTAPAGPLAITNGAGSGPLGKSRFHQATRASKRRTTWARRPASLSLCRLAWRAASWS